MEITSNKNHVEHLLFSMVPPVIHECRYPIKKLRTWRRSSDSCNLFKHDVLQDQVLVITYSSALPLATCLCGAAHRLDTSRMSR
jgi:hypothetical protein